MLTIVEDKYGLYICLSVSMYLFNKFSLIFLVPMLYISKQSYKIAEESIVRPMLKTSALHGSISVGYWHLLIY